MIAAITIGIDPTIELGPVTLAWHGITIALGIMIGGVAAGRHAREHGLDVDPLYTVGSIAALAGIVGGRIFYLLENDPAGLVDPAQLFSGRGFTFAGGVILAAVAIAVYVRGRDLSPRYLTAGALGLPLGVAIGRIGDVINGEHYGPATDFFLAVRNTHPDADVPSPALAYHSGGLYEVLLAAAIFAVVWPLRHRFAHVTTPVWLVLALFAVGRFVIFFFRLDSDELALGLNSAQWTSIVLLIVAIAGAAITGQRRRGAARPAPST
ncbi:MAG: prolipoprotein diacylglyceryl transferase [Solirubrobacteraceae bacterium MAG38_C4-C5]|nr:prolipoprotein diacylglyceryl transferase [Candidatus Siliceabacter maunaloa]